MLERWPGPHACRVKITFVTTNQFVRFHDNLNEFDEMTCKLESSSTENHDLCSFEVPNPTLTVVKTLMLPRAVTVRVGPNEGWG